MVLGRRPLWSPRSGSESCYRILVVPFFLDVTFPQAKGDFERSIISYSSSISFSAWHASDIGGVMSVVPCLCGTAPFSSSISCSKKLQQPISALCFRKKTSAFRFKTALSDSNCPSPILQLSCSNSDKAGLSDSNSFDGRSGKFEQIDSRLPFRISMKIFCLEISNH